MAAPRDIRRCALQVLYQLDVAGETDPAELRATLDASPGGEAAHERGFALAMAAWARKDEADAAIGEIAENWPLYRQPVLDRNILRLAYHELTEELAPPKVVIDEAIELAREFSTDKSGVFVNGVLDRIYHARLAAAGETPPDNACEPAEESG